MLDNSDLDDIFRHLSQECPLFCEINCVLTETRGNHSHNIRSGNLLVGRNIRIYIYIYIYNDWELGGLEVKVSTSKRRSTRFNSQLWENWSELVGIFLDHKSPWISRQ
jgi:hypothetical protein